jgi:hypothetical protein
MRGETMASTVRINLFPVAYATAFEEMLPIAEQGDATAQKQ